METAAFSWTAALPCPKRGFPAAFGGLEIRRLKGLDAPNRSYVDTIRSLDVG